MGFPCFTNRKRSTPESLRPQSPCCNIFSSKSRPPSPPTKKISPRSRNRKLWKMGLISHSGEAPRGLRSFPLPSAAELEKVFRKFDSNGDGKISSSELREMMRSLGHDPSEEEVTLMMTEADSDRNGFVDLSEFVALNTKGVDGAAALKDLQIAFQMFDEDGNGSISAEELHNVMSRLGEDCSMAECRGMVAGVDADGDGQVSFDEFFAMMTNPNVT